MSHEKPDKAEATISVGHRGLELASLNDYWRFAQAVASTPFCPKGMDTPASVLIALQMGAEVGLPPMASLQQIAVINGRPALYGDAMLGVVRASGLFDEEAFDESWGGEGDKYGCTCTVRRLPRGKTTCRTFSVADAKRAGLWGKAGPWTQYPQRMLQLRARAFALRDAFSDVIRGIPIAEEVQDIEPLTTPRAQAAPRKPQSLDDLVVTEPAKDETTQALADLKGQNRDARIAMAVTPEQLEGVRVEELAKCKSETEADGLHAAIHERLAEIVASQEQAKKRKQKELV